MLGEGKGLKPGGSQGEEPVSQQEIPCGSDHFQDHLSGKAGAETIKGQHGRYHTFTRMA